MHATLTHTYIGQYTCIHTGKSYTKHTHIWIHTYMPHSYMYTTDTYHRHTYIYTYIHIPYHTHIHTCIYTLEKKL